MKFDLLIFDLDGTLIDSQVDVGHALNRVLADHGIAPLPAEVIRTHVGYGIQPVLKQTLVEHGVIDVDAALASFTPYYFDRCVDGTVLYDGVTDLLGRLTDHKKVILTNKSCRFIAPIVNGLGIADHFVATYGRESFAKTKPDPLPIWSILAEHGVEADRALMIGDTETDVHAGTNAGVPTCLVTYGYGKPEVLAELKPTYTFDAIGKLLSVFQ